MDSNFKKEEKENYFHHVAHRKFQNSSKFTLWLSLIITLLFTIVEFVGGLVANSLALLSDSLHMLSDVLALALSMIAIYFASKSSNKKYTFGYLRLEIIAAFLNGLALIVISIGIMYEGILRIIKPTTVESNLMIVIASLGLVVNIILTLILVRSLKKESNINIQSALWHFMGDLLNSVGVIIAVIFIHFTGWSIIDPLISITISLVILNGGYKITKNAWVILMEKVPENYDVENIINDIKSIKGVIDIHEFHLWSITVDYNSLSAHVVLDENDKQSSYEVINRVSEMLKNKYGLDHVTLQVEKIIINKLKEDYFKKYQ